MDSRPTYPCHSIEGPLELDGDLSKEVWSRAPEVPLVDVASGTPSFQATTVRLLHDSTRLYLAFHVEDRDIWGSYRNHDDPLHEEEVVEVFLDPYGQGRIYYEFQLSPHGVTFDALVVNRQQFPDGLRNLTTLPERDCRGLEAAVRVEGEIDSRREVSSHWDGELAIPLAELAPPHPVRRGDVWRMNLFRIDRARDGDEFQAWSPTGRLDFHMPVYFGGLEFL